VCNSRKALIQAFIEYRVASQKWNTTYTYCLRAFDKYCDANHSETDITQELVDGWAAKHDTESNFSRNRRILALRGLILYLCERNLTEIIAPKFLHEETSQYTPHAFMEEELNAFFAEADRQVIESKNRNCAFHALTSSVLFRLLYSSGMRTTEARLLKTSDVDLKHGVVHINSTKANLRHFVILHDDTREMLRRYDELATARRPDREFFFLTPNGNCMAHGTLTIRFQKIWKNVSSVRAVPYDLRHNYAITNINSWTDAGFNFHDKFLYLSKSMGHTSLESTRYYYSLVPAFADTIYAQSGKSFDEIVPEVYK